eukprot:scaffold60206_cov24-Phaeocystis_antarctica.AAC.1
MLGMGGGAALCLAWMATQHYAWHGWRRLLSEVDRVAAVCPPLVGPPTVSPLCFRAAAVGGHGMGVTRGRLGQGWLWDGV